MALPNRMTPFGVPEADPARGTLFGNRGCLVDDHGQLARAWRGRRWITCELTFKGRRRRPLMAPGRYTELFFLDEATALAAGHRPCAECRRADVRRFRAAWATVHPGDAERSLAELDHRLHRERTGPRTRALASGLPDGTMVAFDGGAWLVLGGGLRRWTHGGYADRRPCPRAPVEVLTAPTLVGVLAAGWKPRLHASAQAG